MLRREGLTFALTVLAAAVGCSEDPFDPGFSIAGDAALSARPTVPTDVLSPGRYSLELSEGRDGLIYVPEGIDASAPAPVLVLLHGAGGDAEDWEGAFPGADSLGVSSWRWTREP